MNGADIFTHIGALGHVSRLRGLNLVYHFEIEDDTWTVTVHDGDIVVTSGLVGRPDCSLRCRREDFAEFVDGRRAAVLIMQGRLQMRGNLEALLRLRPLFAVAMRMGGQELASEAR